MRALKKTPQRTMPVPLCRCECPACDIGIHCSKENCGHRSQRNIPIVASRRPVASASLPFPSTSQKQTGTLAYTLPFESAECSSRKR
jgi:hypothetical protein